MHSIRICSVSARRNWAIMASGRMGMWVAVLVHFVCPSSALIDAQADLAPSAVDLGSDFTCLNRSYGYYADPHSHCHEFHICLGHEDIKWTFLCPNGTIFNQEYFVCDFAQNVDCDLAKSFYHLNDLFHAESVQQSSSQPPEAEEDTLDPIFEPAFSVEAKIEVLSIASPSSLGMEKAGPTSKAPSLRSESEEPQAPTLDA
eukprot:maker-scaffold809_size94238-snap-gene-0.24 protein:Tk02706 transcript:maker-scaffold809_size94238-snap-gene-0.24-mRNA-1 annotation:"GM14557"